jgi:hypothetical protein
MSKYKLPIIYSPLALSEFEPGQQLIFSRTVRGKLYLCVAEFIRTERCWVLLKPMVAPCQPGAYDLRQLFKDGVVRVRPKNCCLRFATKGTPWPCCHWFDGIDGPIRHEPVGVNQQVVSFDKEPKAIKDD